jgi:hypothetical protein
MGETLAKAISRLSHCDDTVSVDTGFVVGHGGHCLMQGGIEDLSHGLDLFDALASQKLFERTIRHLHACAQALIVALFHSERSLQVVCDGQETAQQARAVCLDTVISQALLPFAEVLHFRL